MPDFGAFKVRSDRQRVPGSQHRRSVGSTIETPDGILFRLPQFPKRITNVCSVEGGIAVELDGGRRKRLLQPDDALTEAAAGVVDSLLEGNVDEGLLEAEFLREDAPDSIELILQEAGPSLRLKSLSTTEHHVMYNDGYGEEKIGHVRKLHSGRWAGSLANGATPGPADHATAEAAMRHVARHSPIVREHHRAHLLEAGGASAAEYRARAESYAGKHGGIGSSEREDIGHGKGRKYPPGFQHIRNALIRQGKSVADASRIAYGALRRWAEGRGKVKSTTRDKARKVLGQLSADKGAGTARRAAGDVKAREAALVEVKRALRRRETVRYATLIEGWLEAATGASAPVSEEPASLRDAAERIATGKGPIQSRSTTDQRVLEAQKAIGREAQEEAMAEANFEAVSRRPRTVTLAGYGRSPIQEPPTAKPDGPQVSIELPPAKGQGRHAAMLVEGEEVPIGERAAGAGWRSVDFEDLKESALTLYGRTQAQTPAGRSYIASAGRNELALIVESLQEAFREAAPARAAAAPAGEESLTEARLFTEPGMRHSFGVRHTTSEQRLGTVRGPKNAKELGMGRWHAVDSHGKHRGAAATAEKAAALLEGDAEAIAECKAGDTVHHKGRKRKVKRVEKGRVHFEDGSNAAESEIQEMDAQVAKDADARGETIADRSHPGLSDRVPDDAHSVTGLEHPQPGEPFREAGSLSGAVKRPGAFRAWLKKKPGEPITDADIAKGLAAGGHPAQMARLAKAFKTVRKRHAMREASADDLALAVAHEILTEAHHRRRGHADPAKDGTMNKKGAGPDVASMSDAELVSAHRHHRRKEHAHRRLAADAQDQPTRNVHESLANQHMGHAAAVSTEHHRRRGRHLHPREDGNADADMQEGFTFSPRISNRFGSRRRKVMGGLRQAHELGFGDMRRPLAEADIQEAHRHARAAAAPPPDMDPADMSNDQVVAGHKHHREMERHHRGKAAQLDREADADDQQDSGSRNRMRRDSGKRSKALHHRMAAGKHDRRAQDLADEHHRRHGDHLQEARRRRRRAPSRMDRMRPRGRPMRKGQEVQVRHRGRRFRAKFIKRHVSGQHAIVHHNGRLLTVPFESIERSEPLREAKLVEMRRARRASGRRRGATRGAIGYGRGGPEIGRVRLTAVGPRDEDFRYEAIHHRTGSLGLFRSRAEASRAVKSHHEQHFDR